MPFDFLIVGAGFFGSTFARVVAEKGKKVFVIDKRNHIGGNCYTEKVKGIDVHCYGPHIFHTNDIGIWNFVNRFSEFNNYQHRVKVNYQDKIYSFPINLMTLYQVWGISDPQQAKEKINSLVIKSGLDNLEDWIISQVGIELYEIFFKGYSQKQWNKNPKELPSFIAKRIPIRLTYDDRYFNDKYQGIPVDGYTSIFEKMLDHPNIKYETNIDFFNNKNDLLSCCEKIVYTGRIDEYYDYMFGHLEYRSLRFETLSLPEDFQGCSIINYTHKDVPYTRIVEHKHFNFINSNQTIITKEYPDQYDINKIPYYPVNDDKNNSLYQKYKKIETNGKIIFGGRLGKYEYKDMHQIIASAITCANKQL
jgi:UDP-galactopyranose mutase